MTKVTAESKKIPSHGALLFLRRSHLELCELCPVAKRLRNPKRQDRRSHRNYYNRHRHTLIEIQGHKYKQPKRPKRNRLLKEVSLFMFYRFAGIQPEDLEEDEERRTPHSATNSTGSPPHRRDSPKDIGMGRKIGVVVRRRLKASER